RGALQSSNRISIEALLNPAVEAEDSTIDLSDEEILQAVRDAREGDGEGEDEGEGDAKEVPSRKEVLQATAIINCFAEKLDDPVARKLEHILASFSRQIRLEAQRNMVATEITDYFTRKIDRTP
ncbi:hypothetical protein JOM56_004936, partial [Amanita muscaria]